VTDTAIAELAPRVGVRDACQAVGAAQASYHRRHRSSQPPARPVPIAHRDRHQPKALSQAERRAILDVLHSERFVDMAPAEVWATLLDEGVYLGSISNVLPAATPGRRNPRTAPPGHPPSQRETGTGCLPA
jgi:putative transposase